MALIKAQHVAGKRYEWNVTEPHVHIRGNTAWIAYVNKGSISDASGTVNQNWLESAFLQKQAGAGRPSSCTARGCRWRLQRTIANAPQALVRAGRT